ncbi:MAG: rRNA maturation RNase YbeY [bacterium]|nr:rRNA maturation RNase YbeY [bacterium]
MFRILISRQSRYPADTKALKKRVKDTLLEHNLTLGEVSIALVGERKMKELSKRHLGEQNRLHEVLSFPALETKGGPASTRGERDFVVPEEELLMLGDIVICYPEARKIAMKRNRMVDDVLGELAEHGTLHLLGIHHEE